MATRATARPRSIDFNAAELMVKTIKGLTMDAVQKANSGHPGMPMGCADLATVLWTEFLVHDPSDPQWFDRDRFVLSAGHGSMLLYSLLHLTGYDLPMSELQNFRQWGSKTAGHPEYGHTPGVDVTTGPLGSGFAAGVGMALAERFLAARYNKPKHRIIDHMTFGVVSDGDLMEGIAAEAASLAGHLGLGKLIYLYDDNHISIDGATDISFGEDVAKRFEAYGWHVQRIDGHDHPSIREAIASARDDERRPSLICCRTTIAKGSPNKANTSASHGAPLGADEVAATKEAMGWPADPFHVPEDLRYALGEQMPEHAQNREDWDARLIAYREAHPELAAELALLIAGELPSQTFAGFDALLEGFEVGGAIASRKASHKILSKLAANHPTLLGGSADLAGSNGVLLPDTPGQSAAHPEGRNLHFGVREHGMAGVCNGMALHGGVRPFDATFLVFSDFMRGAVRLAALMNLPVVHVLTHDSFWLGEDGPTHQPIEHAMSLRLIPNLYVIRPGDAHETLGAWRLAMERKHGPTALLLTRQNLPTLAESRAEDVARGAYVLLDPAGEGDLDGIFIATGSELALAREAALRLAEQGERIRVVSMPCWEAFAEQDAAYRESVLPPSVGRERHLAVEAGSTLGWERYADHVHGIDHFGASAPAEVLAEKFGFTVEGVIERWAQIR
ncbi:transketolase [Pseudenhygromyxa sp. WMMC2535]|uniref:transketolase n=1 Tax=Pseudenhygromyxa sp. WMMC2535 TaxID=2712867 RepID=UPI0015553626|nr:transketolase [Pseudenhygromyxa sp. WMMC2535]NVB39619.1 transketolase [Pseudenhygromyxa sp. WMMC2535]